MRLLSLEIDGFKSFAHKTVIKFQPGMTGIIGPNGSGKSNIIEAIRWVMGEQSAKTLRGGKMVDVIFNGSKDHHPLNRAMVKITLDNSDHYLQSEFSELTVTRKLYRNGDSEYLINDRQVRLKDVVDLFIDSGIGRESFSIISQGRVAAVFNGQPADRRQIIETVAGVAKYKANKQTAEKRLADTTDNLNRVNDIVADLKERIGPLEEQSSLAQDYLEQKKRLDQFDRTKTVRDVLAKRESLEQLKQQLQASQQMADDYQKQARESKLRVSQLQAQNDQLSRDKDDQQQIVTDKVEEIAALKNQQSLANVRREQREKEMQRLVDQHASLSDQLSQARKELTNAQQQVNAQRQERSRLQQDLDDLQQMGAKKRAKKLNHKLEGLQGQQVDLMQQLTSLHNQRTFLQQTHDRNQSQATQSRQELDQRRQMMTKQQAELEDQQKSLTDASAKLQDLQVRLQKEQSQSQQLDANYRAQQKNWYQALGNAESVKRQLQSYKAMMADYTGYYGGVANVLKQRQQFSGLLGPVNELINVPSQYTKAFETVLGSQLQQLVVQTQHDGQAIIQYLVKTRGGRATILPLNTLRGGYRPRTLGQVQGLPGFLGWAPSLINYDSQIQVVVDHLLANTVIADNLQHATTIANMGRHQLRVVTLDGQLINASGAMSGGANRNQRIGLLSQQQHEQQLTSELKQSQRQTSQLEEQIGKLKQAVDASQQAYQKLQQQYQEQRTKVGQLKTNVEMGQSRVQDLERQVKALTYATDQASDENFAAKLAQNRADEEKANQQLSDARNQADQVKKQIHDLAQDTSAKEDQLHELERQLAIVDERLKQMQGDVKRARADVQDLQQQLTANEQSQASLKENTSASDQDQTSSKEALANAQAKLDAARETIKSLSEQLDKARSDMQSATDENERLQELEKAALNDLSKNNDQKGRLEAQIDNGLNRLSERYSMTLDEASIDQSDLDDQELNRQIKLLHRGLADLGDVNLGSIEEYKQVSSRYDFLTGQQQDLLDAKSQLEKTMDEMDQQVKDRFMKAFNEVSQSFSQTFVQIFEGGQAKLVLTEPDQPLTTGVEIMAQPPGKKNQQLSLLSGGEKALTAIALLFAILKVRPVPFAILDEPEAALDDVNVDRFANYLDKFGNTGPQFIVITHRKGTMRNADVLYGVTMQESGISRVVSVDVKKALDSEEDNE